MTLAARFEHIAIAVHLEDLAAWDRLLRGKLGGSASLGGAERRAGFQGGQITYPEGGMLELLCWLDSAEESAMQKYLARQQARAALHHLTFLVDDIDLAIARSQEVGYEPMIGRRSEQWSEFFVREPALRPSGMLIQVLRADKDALLESGWKSDWEPFSATYATTVEVAQIAGVQLACSHGADGAKLFTELLGAERIGRDELTFSDSSMRVWLREGVDEPSHIEVRKGKLELGASDLPPHAVELIRAASRTVSGA